MILSGWCGQRGIPACKWCRSEVCQCELCDHPWRAKAAENKGNQRGPGTAIGENRDGAGSTLATSPGTSTSTPPLRGSASRG